MNADNIWICGVNLVSIIEWELLYKYLEDFLQNRNPKDTRIS